MKLLPRCLAVFLVLAVAGCTSPADPSEAAPQWEVEVLATHPHDPQAFTQGLFLDGDLLYESTGRVGESQLWVRRWPTGTEVARVALGEPYFGEGISRFRDRVWQLTWRAGVAIARDPHTLAEIHRASYSGEGWGLCTAADRLVMSDGSSTLTFRDPVTFAETGSVTLTSHTSAQLNELDCAPDGSIYANSWLTEDILRIDPGTGTVLAVIDASGLLSPQQQAGADVLNGIAHIPGTDRFLLTGKYWPTMFEVRFIPRHDVRQN